VAGVTPVDPVEGGLVPLIRIDVVEGRRSPEELRLLLDASPGDRPQVITQHRRGQLISADTGLRIERCDDLVVLRVFQQGRSDEQERALTTRRADWSFELGPSPVLDGEL
jgi:hypothetical protein